MNIKFEVAPYALFDTLKALASTNDSNRYIEFGVTKEDGNLTVWASERWHKTDFTQNTSCIPE